MSSIEVKIGNASPVCVLADRIRICYVNHTAMMGGGEISLLNIVRKLNRQRYTPIVILFSEGPLADQLRQEGIELHILPLRQSVSRAKKDSLGLHTLLRGGDIVAATCFIFRLSRLIRKLGVHIVHTNSLKSDIMGGFAARLAGVPLVWHVRDRITSDYLPAKVVALFRFLARHIPHVVVANSKATLATVKVGTKKPSLVLYSGIDASKIFQASQVSLDEHDINRTSTEACERQIIKLGLIGRITPWKGQHIFLQAASMIHAKHPSARFQIIGGALFAEEQYEKDLRKLCSSLNLDNIVEFLGHRRDIPFLVNQLDILVHASTTGEPFGQVVVEGMAAAKPVIATNGGGVPEIVIDGVTGVLVPMNDSEALAKAMDHLLSNPEICRRMGQQGRDRVIECFTIDRTILQAEQLYESLGGAVVTK